MDNFDMIEFANELVNSGLLANFEKAPLSLGEFDAYIKQAGLKSFVEIQADVEAQSFQNELAQIWAFFGELNDRGEYGKFDGHLSYSFLKHVDSIRNPKPFYNNTNKERNFALGRAFEDMLTDCFDISKFPDLETSDFANLEKMCSYAKSDFWIRDFLKMGYETQKEFKGIIKGFKFKGKVDFYNRELDIIGDLKTTSAKTLNAFKKACFDFGYYTQGFIYTHLANIESVEDYYIIAGVCKSMPAVFTVSMNESDMEAGGKDLDRLIENLAYYGIADKFKA